jgi:hypothetical protein
MPRLLARALDLTAGSRLPVHAGSPGLEGGGGCGLGGLVVGVGHIDKGPFVGGAFIAFVIMAVGENRSGGFA